MSDNIKKILVIGLGSMGLGIAKSLLRSGHQVYGQDKSSTQIEKFKKHGGINTDIPYDKIDVVIIVVLNEIQTRDILFGKDALSKKLKANSLVMVCTTVSPKFAKEMDILCQSESLLYLDAPISGGSKKSSEGKLSYMISGDKKSLAIAKPILEAT